MLFSTVVAATQGQFCDSTNLCVYGHSDGGNTIFTVHSSSTGWAAFGIGSKMKSAKIFNGWKNSSGGYVVVEADGTGHRQPTPSSPQRIKQIPLQVAAPSWAKIAYSFSVPSDGISSSTNYIYAYSSKAPTGNIDSISASYKEHDDNGKFVADFTAAAVASVSRPIKRGLKPTIK